MGSSYRKSRHRVFPLLGLLYLCALLQLSALSPALAQTFSISGRILDDQQHPLPAVNVIDLATGRGAVSNDSGEFTLKLKTSQTTRLRFSAIGYGTIDTTLSTGTPPPTHTIILPTEDTQIDAVEIGADTRTDATVERIFLPDQSAVSTAGAGVESLLKTLPGVSSRNELSSQRASRSSTPTWSNGSSSPPAHSRPTSATACPRPSP